MKAVLEIEGLKKYYGKSGNQTKALDGISLQVMEGEFLGIMGSSGSGKSGKTDGCFMIRRKI